MSSSLLGTENDAALYLQSRQIGTPLAKSLSLIVPPATSYSFGNYFINNWYQLQSFFAQRIPNTFQEPTSIMKVVGISIFILVIITALIFLYNYVKTQTEGFKVSNDNEINNQIRHIKDITNSLISAKLASKENTTPESPLKLLYLQMPTFKQISYIGNNLFDKNHGVLQQLKAGCRTFFCQIDYIESEALNNKNFCKIYEPCFIWKDNAGKLISKNSSSIEETFKYIGEYGFSDSVTNYQYPIILFLHFVRFPYKPSDEKYKIYLSKVSKSLEVLNSHILSGGYYRASKENDLFKGDFLAMGKSIIIGTNIDTSLFQKNKVEQINDLDYKIHFHYYETIDENVDETAVVIPSNNPFALIYNIDTLLNMSEKDISKFIQINKDKFIIVKTPNNKNPTKDQVDSLLNIYKVNIILYDYFTSTMDESRSIISLYGNTTYKTISNI
jgi:hypothetical protein